MADVRRVREVYSIIATRQIDVTSDLDRERREVFQQMEPGWRPIASRVNKQVYCAAIDHRSDYSVPTYCLLDTARQFHTDFSR